MSIEIKNTKLNLYGKQTSIGFDLYMNNIICTVLNLREEDTVQIYSQPNYANDVEDHYNRTVPRYKSKN